MNHLEDTRYSRQILTKLDIFKRFSKILQMSNFIKIPAVGGEVFHSDRETDRQTDGHPDGQTDR